MTPGYLPKAPSGMPWSRRRRRSRQARRSASRDEPLYWLVNAGARVLVERERDGWTLIRAICTDGYTRRAYMMAQYLEEE